MKTRDQIIKDMSEGNAHCTDRASRRVNFLMKQGLKSNIAIRKWREEEISRRMIEEARIDYYLREWQK